MKSQLKILRITLALILFITASLKFLLALGEVQVLGQPSSVFSPLTVRQILGFTSLLEFIIACSIIVLRSHLLAGLLGIWFEVAVFLYRGAKLFLGVKEACLCMGNLTQWLGLAPKTADHLSQGLAVLIIILSLALCISQPLKYAQRNFTLFQKT